MAEEAEVHSIEEFRKMLEVEASKSWDPEPEPEPEPEVEAPVLASGRLVVEYKNSVIVRDSKGRISEIVSETGRKVVKRDEDGIAVGVVEVSEREEED